LGKAREAKPYRRGDALNRVCKQVVHLSLPCRSTSSKLNCLILSSPCPKGSKGGWQCKVTYGSCQLLYQESNNASPRPNVRDGGMGVNSTASIDSADPTTELRQVFGRFADKESPWPYR
jgi:hypothetical protein